MQHITDEFISLRLGEPMEERLQGMHNFRDKLKKICRVQEKMKHAVALTKELRELWEENDRLNAEYNGIYAKEAYRLGYGDAVQIESEHQIRSERSVLTAEDMEHMVCIYDVIERLEDILLGETPFHDREGGMMGVMRRIFCVLEDSVCSEIAMRGEEELDEYLTEVLDNKDKSAGERARMLLGVGNKG